MKVRKVERFLKRMRKYSAERKALKMEESMKEHAGPMGQDHLEAKFAGVSVVGSRDFLA